MIKITWSHDYVCQSFRHMVISSGRFVSSYGHFITVSSSHQSYLIKDVLGVQQFVITLIIKAIAEVACMF